MSDWVTIGRESDLPSGALRGVQIGETSLAMGRLEDGTLVAFSEWCTHEECPLSDGDLEGDHVVCYCHSGEFDVRTGMVMKGPPEDPLQVYEIRAMGGELQVRIDDS